MSTDGRAPGAPGRVLATLEQDGSRRWIFPRLSRGRFLRRRFVVAWMLLLAFLLPTHLRLGGGPLVLLDVVHRRFTLFGRTFLTTDLALLMLFALIALVGIVLLTAIVGRAWCGWACPQTVYLEFLFRPVERLVEGTPAQRAAQPAPERWLRRGAKLGVFLVMALVLAHSFLAWFVGWDDLAFWVQRSPLDHPGSFGVMAVTTALVLLDFGWFREQTCLVACPYGRLQSVLLDRNSLIVGYDVRRGEPRGRRSPRAEAPGASPLAAVRAGDCVNCSACVVTCPTGIDIRDGLQMECIGCTQCIDACDAIMDRVGLPRGLIRYTSAARLAGEKTRLIRPRVVIYPLVIILMTGLLAARLAGPPQTELTVLRPTGAPFTELPGGLVSTAVRLKLVNRTRTDHSYRIGVGAEVQDADGPHLVSPQNPVPVAAGGEATAPFFVIVPRSRFVQGTLPVTLTVEDGEGFVREIPHVLMGPS